MSDAAPLPRVTGILESALYVESLERAYAFYEAVFGFERLFQDDRLCALGVAGRQVLLLFLKGASSPGENVVPGGVIPPHDGGGSLHLAFAIPADSLASWEARLAKLRIEVQGRVNAPRGGTSLYFRDPDGHLVELATPGLWTIY